MTIRKPRGKKKSDAVNSKGAWQVFNGANENSPNENMQKGFIQSFLQQWSHIPFLSVGRDSKDAGELCKDKTTRRAQISGRL